MILFLCILFYELFTLVIEQVIQINIIIIMIILCSTTVATASWTIFEGTTKVFQCYFFSSFFISMGCIAATLLVLVNIHAYVKHDLTKGLHIHSTCKIGMIRTHSLELSSVTYWQ